MSRLLEVVGLTYMRGKRRRLKRGERKRLRSLSGGDFVFVHLWLLETMQYAISENGVNFYIRLLLIWQHLYIKYIGFEAQLTPSGAEYLPRYVMQVRRRLNSSLKGWTAIKPNLVRNEPQVGVRCCRAQSTIQNLFFPPVLKLQGNIRA